MVKFLAVRKIFPHMANFPRSPDPLYQYLTECANLRVFMHGLSRPEKVYSHPLNTQAVSM